MTKGVFCDVFRAIRAPLLLTDYGVTSLIKKLNPNEFVIFRHSVDIKMNEQQEREKEWTGGTESYTLTENNGVTTLIVNTDVPKEQEEISS